jgi:hypothetical protein
VLLSGCSSVEVMQSFAIKGDVGRLSLVETKGVVQSELRANLLNEINRDEGLCYHFRIVEGTYCLDSIDCDAACLYTKGEYHHEGCNPKIIARDGVNLKQSSKDVTQNVINRVYFDELFHRY